VTPAGPAIVMANLTVELRRLQRKLVCVSRRLEPTGRARRAHHEHLVEQHKVAPRTAPYKPVVGRARRLLERQLRKVQRRSAQVSQLARQYTAEVGG
jgi:hypothetical protein